VAAIAVESIYFSSTFATIFWLKELKLPLDGLFKANLSILTDEIDHYTFTTHLFKNHLKEEIDDMKVKSILLDAVDVEKQFIDDCIGDGVDGVKGEELKKYVEFVCDIVLQNMGFDKHFNTEHNLRFMDGIGIQKTVNFFEKRSTNYIKAEGNVGINLDNF
jgi:ribonucleotide reductase beta subunit family protein with ferritin-like domain